MVEVLTVFRHEWVGFARSRTLLLMLVIAGGIGGGVALAEYGTWRAEQKERLELQVQETEQWLALGDTHIHKAAHRGYFVIRDLPPGTMLDRGVWDFGGSSIWLEAHRRNAPQLRAADTAAVIARGAPRGLGPVLLWLVPLLSAVLLHPIFASERTRGSLAFAVSSGASPGAIVFGKAFAAVTLAWAAAGLPIVLGAGLAIQSGTPVASAAAWSAGLLTALAVFAAMVVIVSSLTRRPLGALVSLLLIWFAMAVFWPRFAPGLVQQVAPLPSSQTVRSEAEAAAEGLVTEATVAAVVRRLAEAGVAEPNPSGVSAMAAELDAAATFARIFAPLEEGMQRQAALLDMASWASPLAAADRAADATLGLGDRDQFAFEARAERMRIATQMALNEGWVRSDGTGRGDPALWREVVEAAKPVSEPRTASGHAGWGLVLWVSLSTLGLFGAAHAVRRAI